MLIKPKNYVCLKSLKDKLNQLTYSPYSKHGKSLSIVETIGSPSAFIFSISLLLKAKDSAIASFICTRSGLLFKHSFFIEAIWLKYSSSVPACIRIIID